jgi:hypothetical protein
MKNYSIPVIILGVFVSSPSFSDENWLVGTWEFDREATYSQFESMDPRPEEIIACYEEGRCGVGDRTLYTKTEQARLLDKEGDGTFVEVGKGRGGISVENAEQVGDEFIVTLARSWTDKNLTHHFIRSDQYYAVINFKSFTWRYYQKRVLL